MEGKYNTRSKNALKVAAAREKKQRDLAAANQRNLEAANQHAEITMESELFDVEKKLCETKSKISAEERKLFDLKSKISDAEKNLCKLNSEISAEESKLFGLKGEISHAEKSLLNAGSLVSAEEKKLCELNGEISAKESELFDVKSKISDVEKSLLEAGRLANSEISAKGSKPFDSKSTISIADGLDSVGIKGVGGEIPCADGYGMGDVGLDGEENTTAHFVPVVQLEEVEVRSGEEDEDVLSTARATLFTYGETVLNKGTGKKTWVESGTGNIRFLQHKEKGYIRVLMRQEKTETVVCNFKLYPQIKLQPQNGSNRSWVWHALDFANGQILEAKFFACRFKDSDLANAFKEKFETYQMVMKDLLEGADAEDTSAGDAVAQAFVNVTTRDEE